MTREGRMKNAECRMVQAAGAVGGIGHRVIGFSLVIAALVIGHFQPASAAVIDADLCVFGGTSAGIAAAVQAARLGKTVVLAEPGKYLGGLTTGGIGATDIGNKAAPSGVARGVCGGVAGYDAPQKRGG